MLIFNLGRMRSVTPIHLLLERLLNSLRVECAIPVRLSCGVLPERVRNDKNWFVFDVSSGHDVMLDSPAKLAEILQHAI